MTELRECSNRRKDVEEEEDAVLVVLLVPVLSNLASTKRSNNPI